MDFTLAELEEACTQKLVYKRTHPLHKDVVLYNYTQKAQYSSSWTAPVMASRGLILRNGVPIALPFSKFFNVSEHVGHKDKIPPHTHWELYDKMDGSLGVVFWLDGWQIATRGSFQSPQATVATTMLNKLNLSAFDINYTYLVEIIYPENQIVVDYKERHELVLLGARHTLDGHDITYDELSAVATVAGCKTTRLVAVGNTPFESWSAIDDYLKTTYTCSDGRQAEGFVIVLRSEHGPIGVQRAKWKFPAYTQLHKTLSHVTNVHVWEHMQAGTLDSLLDTLPDEGFAEVRREETRLVEQYAAIMAEVEIAFATVPEGTPRERANIIRTHKYAKILFALNNGNEKIVKHCVWQLCKPDICKDLYAMMDDN